MVHHLIYGFSLVSLINYFPIFIETHKQIHWLANHREMVIYNMGKGMLCVIERIRLFVDCKDVSVVLSTAELLPVTQSDSASLHQKSLHDLIYDFISSECLLLLGNLLLIFDSSPLHCLTNPSLTKLDLCHYFCFFASKSKYKYILNSPGCKCGVVRIDSCVLFS